MAKIYERLEVGAVGMSVTGASDVIDDTLGIKQSVINENVIQGKILKNGNWESNTSTLTEATTDTLGGIRVANVREDVDVYPEFGGSAAINRNYGVELDQRGKAFVHVPWVQYALGTASHEILGGVMTGDNTGIKVEGQVIKADFDTIDYSKVEDITAYGFSTTTVASPNVVNKIVEAKLQYVFSDILDTPL